jgi:hypothetical protein
MLYGGATPEPGRLCEPRRRMGGLLGGLDVIVEKGDILNERRMGTL